MIHYNSYLKDHCKIARIRDILVRTCSTALTHCRSRDQWSSMRNNRDWKKDLPGGYQDKLYTSTSDIKEMTWEIATEKHLLSSLGVCQYLWYRRWSPWPRRAGRAWEAASHHRGRRWWAQSPAAESSQARCRMGSRSSPRFATWAWVDSQCVEEPHLPCGVFGSEAMCAQKLSCCF